MGNVWKTKKLVAAVSESSIIKHDRLQQIMKHAVSHKTMMKDFELYQRRIKLYGVCADWTVFKLFDV